MRKIEGNLKKLEEGYLLRIYEFDNQLGEKVKIKLTSETSNNEWFIGMPTEERASEILVDT